MELFLTFLENNIWWIFLALFFGGGALLEAFGKGLSGRGANRRLRAKLKLRTQELERTQKLLETIAGNHGTPVSTLALIESGNQASRMARLLDKVQEADTALPQLTDSLRTEIDDELDAYHADSKRLREKKK